MTLLSSPRIRNIPSREVLEGLARLHPFVLLVDQHGQIAWMSEPLGRQLGCTSSRTAAGQQPGSVASTHDLLARISKPEQLEALREGLLRHKHACVHLDLSAGDGQQIGVEASAFQVEAEHQAGPHYVVIVRPDSEDSVLDRDTSTALDVLSGILDSSPDAVIATDRAGFITHANSAVEKFLRHGPSDLIGKPLALVLPDSDGLERTLERFRRPIGMEEEEIEYIGVDGRSTWAAISTRPLRLKNGDTAGVVITLRDVNKRRQTQAELRQKNLDLESYVETVAHDLRSPLVSLLGFTRLLRLDYEAVLDQTGHHFLDRVEQAGRTMEALIHDILELSHIRGPGEIRSLADPRTVLVRLEAELKLRLEEQSVELVLPEAPPLLRIDSTRLYQIFSNLIGNALTHMGPCEDPRIEVAISEHDDHHHICVMDNGRGISPEQHDIVFEISQASRARLKRDDQSPGIGLAIVKRVAETHGGRAWVESELGQGARFHVTLPRS